jgi:predicted short-subunit dehydrogenase-like oxidoreductase (DUF2520 family)
VIRASNIGIAGTGRVAQALGRALREAGEPVTCLAGRDAERTRAAADFIGVEAIGLDVLPGRAERILIAVSDGAILEVASLLAAAGVCPCAVLHTSGALGEEALAPLARLGAACGTLHPLQTIANAELGVDALRGVAYAVSGTGEALEWAISIAECLGGTVLPIRPEARARYHAAAALASNAVVALLDAAMLLLGEAGVDDPATQLHALAPLARAAVDSVFTRGPAAALTGPVERGDAETVARHLAALAGPQRELYRAVSLAALDLARRKGLDEERASRVGEILQRSTN